jgi:hypothetical protein
MELHGFDGKLFVAHAHNDTVRGFGGHFKASRQLRFDGE